MRKLFYVAALLGGSLLPMAPPAEAQRAVVMRPPVVVRSHPRRGRFFYRGRWYNHRRFRRGHWHYW
jgi:hypothetical protein